MWKKYIFNGAETDYSVSTEGIVIRLECNSISRLGRITSGVKLIDMSDDITVASIAKVRAEDTEAERAEAELAKAESADGEEADNPEA